MATENRTYKKLDAVTRKWWFFLGLLSLQLLPPLTWKNFDFNEMYEMITTTLGSAIFYSCGRIFPIFQILAISVFAVQMVFRNKSKRIFAVHAGVSYLLFVVTQMTAITPKYGVSVIPSGVIMFGLVAAMWFWEAFSGLNDFSKRKQSIWRYTVAIPAIIAFWMPLNLTTGKLDFNFLNFVTSGSALTFCLMTPAYLAILLFFYPNVNRVTLRVTSTVGTIIAIFNIPSLFVPRAMWIGILHLPLLFTSVLGLILSMRNPVSVPNGFHPPID